uniref:Uncharacterized protein n=1 Tax=Arundo donax TaxID=35708 RepID=A0A0A9CDK2_ARUDO
MSFTDNTMLSLPLSGLASLRLKYTGSIGIGSGVVLFSSMNTTADMRGLESGLSCTHKSPM